MFLSLIYLQKNYLHDKLTSYVSEKAQQRFGTKSIAKDQENKIKSIARAMNVSEPIVIRKMNHNALITFGYYNAFAHFPLLFDFIPVGSKPFLFVSEGFFEDLSPKEQLFLIGHEMVHIKEKHTIYLNLLLNLFFLGLFLFWLFFKKIINKNAFIKKHSSVFSVIYILLFFISLTVPNLVSLAYKRHIERVADYKSIEKLKSYDGGIKLLERWKKEFRLPDYNPHYDLFSDHPSNAERKQCFLKLKNRSKEIDEKYKTT